jgi:hypothetical protein
LNRLDPTIKHHLRKAGISMIQNVYSGFDTEFKNEEICLNTLISTQLAISTKTFIKIPRVITYKISIVDIQSNKRLKINKNSSVCNYSKIEGSIDICIQEIRRLKYENYDDSMFILNESLRQIKGLGYLDNDEYTLFRLPQSSIQPYIIFENSTTLEKLLNISSVTSKPYLEKSYNHILELLRKIYSTGLTLQAGKERLLEEIYLNSHDYEKIALLAEESEKTITCIV